MPGYSFQILPPPQLLDAVDGVRVKKTGAQIRSARKSIKIELPPPRPSDSDPDAPSFIVGIGASAGGLEALEQLLKAMPPDTGMAFVIVQHLSPDFKSLMNELLTRVTSMQIRVVEPAMLVRKNCVYLLPPRKDMIISGQKLHLHDRAADQHLNMPINTFFRSLAQDARERAIAVVLSGTGTDGSSGLLDVHSMGGLVVVQSEESAKFDGMPRAAIDTGLADIVLPPEDIPQALQSYALNPDAPLLESTTGRASPEILAGLPAIIDQLRQRFNLDFSHYKAATVCRRIDRRLALRNCASFKQYLKLVSAEPAELDTLFKDLLIGVTRFFRDPEVWDLAGRKIIPAILRDKKPEEEVRVWVPGCATGEEPYSIAMLFQEAMDQMEVRPTVRLFATDVHAHSLQVASEGLYEEASLIDISPARRDRFFVQHGKQFRIHPELRKMLILSTHNVIKDPPFTKIDLLSCRNMLIYLLPAAQTKALASFHFALRLHGTMIMGPSESPGAISEEFETVDRQWKVYRKIRDSRLPIDMRMSAAPSLSTSQPTYRAGVVGDLRLARAYEYVLSHYTRDGILLNEKREILHVFGEADRFLRPPTGKISNDVFSMLQGDLRIALSSALQIASKQNEISSFKGVRFQSSQDHEDYLIDVSVDPILDKTSNCTYFFVAFQQQKQILKAEANTEQFSLDAESRSRIEHLEEELMRTKQSLQTSVEELQTTNEELQATNEELLASNEELQSTNEELHSVNEELYSVNAEHELKIRQLSETTNDLNNLMNSTKIGTIFLDRNHCIRLFTPAAAQIFNLLPQDLGRDIKHITYRVKDDDIFEAIEDVAKTRHPRESNVIVPNGRTYLRRVMPYLDESPTVAGIVLTFVDVTDVMTTQRQLRLSEFSVNNASSPTLWVNAKGHIVRVNAAICALLGYSEQELLSMSEYDIHPRLSGSAWSAHWNELRKRQRISTETELRHQAGHTFPVEMDLNWFKFEGEEYRFVFVRDISERRRVERLLARSEQLFRSTFDLATVGIMLITLDGRIAEANQRVCEFLDQTPEQIINRSILDIVSPEDRAAEQDLLAKARLRQLGEYDYERTFVRSDGQIVWGHIHGTGTIVEGSDGSEPRLLRVIVDVTDRKRIQDALLNSEERFRLLIENAPQAMVMVDSEGSIMLINSKGEALFGYTRDELTGRSEDLLFPERSKDDQTRFRNEMLHSSDAAKALPDRSFNARRKGGSELPVELSVSRVSMGGKDYLLKIITDISRRRSDERALKDSLAEKETMLKEIHHRVKNNLQLISSLLRLQSDHLQIDIPALRECEQRVKAMALIHEKLYQAKSLARIDFSEYISSLMNILTNAYGLGNRITVHLDVQPVEVGVDVAIPLGLALNELISNCLKHAFPNDRAGNISVAMGHDPEGMYMTLADDGVGFPEGFNWQQCTSLGLHLVQILARQLQASVEVSSANGTQFRLRFHQPHMAGRPFYESTQYSGS